MSRARIALTIIYLLLLGQFLFANFVHSFGPSYTLSTASYKQAYDRYCPPQSQIPPGSGECLINCPVMDHVGLGPVVKGFPFVLYHAYNSCGIALNIFDSSSFLLATILNWIYILILTGLYMLEYIRLGHHKTKTVPRKKPRPKAMKAK